MNLKGMHLNLEKIFMLSNYFKLRLKKFNKENIFIENNNLLSAYYGIPSPFCPPIDNFSIRYKKNVYKSYKKLVKQN